MIHNAWIQLPSAYAARFSCLKGTSILFFLALRTASSFTSVHHLKCYTVCLYATSVAFIPQQKVLAQDSWARWPGSCPRGQGLAQETKILSKRPNLAQDLAQVLRQDPEQDFGSHNLGILDKILGKSWARGGKSWASLRQVVLRKNFLLGTPQLYISSANRS